MYIHVHIQQKNIYMCVTFLNTFCSSSYTGLFIKKRRHIYKVLQNYQECSISSKKVRQKSMEVISKLIWLWSMLQFKNSMVSCFYPFIYFSANNTFSIFLCPPPMANSHSYPRFHCRVSSLGRFSLIRNIKAPLLHQPISCCA